MRPRKEFSPHSVIASVRAACALAILLLTTLAAAQTLTGTVKNSTTGKPAAGDEVVLLKLGQGMEEAGRTKTDAKGQFSFKLDDDSVPAPGPRHSSGRHLPPHGPSRNHFGRTRGL